MSQNYRRIGDYLSVVDNRNIDGSINNLIGISIDKRYMPSVANIIGTDLSNYKIITKGQFACSLMQVSRDQRIPLAIYSSPIPAIMSPAYVIFEVNKPEVLLPEYLDLWFKRSEFDREASFYAVGGVRGSLDWEDFCKMEIPIPSITEQRKMVEEYYVINDRISLLRKINGNLISQCEVLYKRMIEGKEPNGQLGDISCISSGKRNEDMCIGSIPLLGAGGIMGYVSDYNYDEPAIVIGRVGTHGVVQRCKRFWASDNTLVIIPQHYELVFQILRNIDYSVLNRGSTQPLITQGDLNKLQIYIPSNLELNSFENASTRIMALYSNYELEIATLRKLSELLLSKLF